MDFKEYQELYHKCNNCGIVINKANKECIACKSKVFIPISEDDYEEYLDLLHEKQLMKHERSF